MHQQQQQQNWQHRQLTTALRIAQQHHSRLHWPTILLPPLLPSSKTSRRLTLLLHRCTQQHKQQHLARSTSSSRMLQQLQLQTQAHQPRHPTQAVPTASRSSLQQATGAQCFPQAQSC
jgi:hypothetical protein